MDSLTFYRLLEGNIPECGQEKKLIERGGGGNLLSQFFHSGLLPNLRGARWLESFQEQLPSSSRYYLFKKLCNHEIGMFKLPLHFSYFPFLLSTPFLTSFIIFIKHTTAVFLFSFHHWQNKLQDPCVTRDDC